MSDRSQPLQVVRTDATDPGFRALVAELDKDLAIRDGDDHAFFAQFNRLLDIRHVVVVRANGEAVGCGAFKPYADDAVEIKRMYVPPVHRKKGIASTILRELERWAASLGYKRCVLETGEKQPEAIGLYTKSGYRIIPNYGQYAEVESSVCFAKPLP
ncbi:MAG TPA: GNAT family N-acetyltransferase [Flavobacteriales bacterium]